jgi:hypothetical protein
MICLVLACALNADLLSDQLHGLTQRILHTPDQATRAKLLEEQEVLAGKLQRAIDAKVDHEAR